MKHSDSLTHLAEALSKAQAEMPTITKDATNPHFKSRFASLDATIATVRPILAKHGLSIVQGASTPDRNEAGVVVAFTVETMLLHVSGEWIVGGAIMPLAKQDAQGAGGAMTYGRRYGLAALLCLATDEDDDGNSASRPAKAPPKQQKAPARPEDRIVNGKKLGDYTTPNLEAALQWAREKGKADLEADIETVLEARGAVE